MKLYDYELSGNCYKVRYLLHALDLPCEKVAINFFPGREHRSAWFVDTINPRGQIPVLEDHDGVLLRDAQAILVYLASAHDARRQWYPDDARVRGDVQLWLGVADEITRSAGAARLHEGFGFEAIDAHACRLAAHALFRLIDDHLADRLATGRRWLAADHVTIADLACFPYVALAPEGGIVLDEYPALRQWLWDFRHQPGFIAMPGILSPGL